MNERDKLMFWTLFAQNFMYEGCQQRPGQAMMNVLRHWPELHREVQGTERDPWDIQERIPEFRRFIGV